MLLSLFQVIFALTFSQAAHVESMHCEPAQNATFECKIRIGGKIVEGEKLFLPTAQDSDQLKFENWVLGETGYLLKYPFAANQFPRVYSLQPLTGKENVDLILTTHSYFPNTSRPPSKVRVIDPSFSLRKVYLPVLLNILSFLAVCFLSMYLLRRLPRQTIDGWIYPVEDLRIYIGSLIVFYFLSSDWTHAGVPSLWSANFHFFAQKLSVLVGIYCSAILLLSSRFYDRSSTTRLTQRPVTEVSLFVLNFSFLLSALLILPPSTVSWGLSFLPLSLGCFFVAWSVGKNLEWRRILKRSAISPLIFHLSLFLVSGGAILAAPLFLALRVSTEKFYIGLSLISFLAAIARAKRFETAKGRALFLSKECREILTNRVSGLERLQGICEFLEDEFGAARVSILSIHQEKGLLLASAGPDAISLGTQTASKKLGPFLKRVCKEGHLMYAPVAEELEKELQNEGMKHSSLAFPFRQGKVIKAVLCMMADEGERIPAIELAVLEIFFQELQLEILSCVSQQVAEERSDRLLALARESNALAVEHLDTWGYLQYKEEGEKRFLLGWKLSKSDPLMYPPLLEKVFREFQKELQMHFECLATSFEFVVKESKQDFWIVSPGNFQSSFLHSLGPSGAAILLGTSMEKVFHSYLAKPCFSVLGNLEYSLVIGEVNIRFQSNRNHQKNSIEVDAEDYQHLVSLRNQSKSSLLFSGMDSEFGLKTESSEPSLTLNLKSGDNHSVHCLFVGFTGDQKRKIHQVLSMHSNKKELRKIEIRSQELLREQKRVA